MSRILKNEVLFECILNIKNKTIKDEDIMQLHKQSYIDGTCFYILKEKGGIDRIQYMSNNIGDLISQMEKELKISMNRKKENIYKNNNELKNIYDSIIRWRNEIIKKLKLFV